jgi:hypothetical protein
LWGEAIESPELVVHGPPDILEGRVWEDLHAAALQAAEEEAREVPRELLEFVWLCDEGVGIGSGGGLVMCAHVK